MRYISLLYSGPDLILFSIGITAPIVGTTSLKNLEDLIGKLLLLRTTPKFCIYIY